jgi:hypothetical protein
LLARDVQEEKSMQLTKAQKKVLALAKEHGGIAIDWRSDVRTGLKTGERLKGVAYAPLHKLVELGLLEEVKEPDGTTYMKRGWPQTAKFNNGRTVWRVK